MASDQPYPAAMRKNDQFPPLPTVQTIYAAIANRALGKVMSALAPDIFVRQSSVLRKAGMWHGHDGFRATTAAIYSAWPDFVVPPRRFFGDGDKVAKIIDIGGAANQPMPLGQALADSWRVVCGLTNGCRPLFFDPMLAAASDQSGD